MVQARRLERWSAREQTERRHHNQLDSEHHERDGDRIVGQAADALCAREPAVKELAIRAAVQHAVVLGEQGEEAVSACQAVHRHVDDAAVEQEPGASSRAVILCGVSLLAHATEAAGR